MADVGDHVSQAGRNASHVLETRDEELRRRVAELEAQVESLWDAITEHTHG